MITKHVTSNLILRIKRALYGTFFIMVAFLPMAIILVFVGALPLPKPFDLIIITILAFFITFSAVFSDETDPKRSKKLDGRKARWFDCDWNNDTNLPNGCGVCKVCKYLDFLDYAHSVCPPEGLIAYNREIDKYVELKTLQEKHKWLAEKKELLN